MGGTLRSCACTAALTLAGCAWQESGTHPDVAPNAEGQIGTARVVGDRVLGPIPVEAIGADGSLVFGGIFAAGRRVPEELEVQLLAHEIQATRAARRVARRADPFYEVELVTPTSSWSQQAENDGELVAFSYAVDGALPHTMTVRLASLDETGSLLIETAVAEDIDTFIPHPGFLPDPAFAKTAVGVDSRGQAVVAYTELSSAGPRVMGLVVDARTGEALRPTFPITGRPHANPDLALLTADGSRLIVVTSELSDPTGVHGSIVDMSGSTPAVTARFRVDQDVASFGSLNPTVASDLSSGTFTVVWEHVVGSPGNPVDVLARRYDDRGNPLGNEFVVSSPSAHTQGQPAVAYGLEGLSAIVWAGDPLAPRATGDRDVFLRVYDPRGRPIGDQILVNTFTAHVQDLPSVRFLPDRDHVYGRVQVLVVWRDVGTPDGGRPRGTGISYRRFSIRGYDQQVPIFGDGFESGGVESWSGVSRAGQRERSLWPSGTHPLMGWTTPTPTRRQTRSRR